MRKTKAAKKPTRAFWKSPLFVVCATATFIIGLRTATYLRPDSVDPQVVIETGRNRQPLDETAKTGMVNPIAFDSTVIRTADRKREAAAIILAAGLYITNESLQRRPPQNVASIIAGLIKQDLLPPGITGRTASGALASTHAAIYLRYRPYSTTIPFGIEVVSIGHERSDGPAMLIQLSGDDNDQSISFFQATHLEEATIPQPFAHISDIIAAGWTREFSQQ